VLTLGGHREEGIKGHHTIDLGSGYIHSGSNHLLHFSGKVPKMFLCFVKDIYQLQRFIIERIADLVDLVNILLSQFNLYT
jgi:hypothetical protein